MPSSPTLPWRVASKQWLRGRSSPALRGFATVTLPSSLFLSPHRIYLGGCFRDSVNKQNTKGTPGSGRALCERPLPPPKALVEPPSHPPGLWTPAQTDRKGTSGQEGILEAEVLPHGRTETGEQSPGGWPGITGPGSCTRFPWGGILSPTPSPGSDSRLQETACHLTAQGGPGSTAIFRSGWNTASARVTPGPGSQGLPNPSRARH